jgi:RimK family alpha-L-glutamate ligase
MILILTGKRSINPKAKKFIKLLGKNLSQNGSTYSVASFQDIEVFLSDTEIRISVSGKPIDTWSTIYPRKVSRYSGLAFILASYAKIHGITFIDRFRGSNSDNTKLLQMYLFATGNIPIPKTYHSATYDKKQISHAIGFLGFPIIIKQCNTSKGSGVAIAANRTELEEKIRGFLEEKPGKEVILQEFIDNSFEYRIFVTGKTIAVAEKKTRLPGNEFRNNVHLGALEEFFDPRLLKKSIARVALDAARTVNVQVAGVDIVVDSHGQPRVFEVNSCPGFTLDEKISDEIRKLSLYLSSCEKNS